MPVLLVHLEVEQLTAAEQEVASVPLLVEGDDVVREQPLVDVLADVARQHAPGVRLGPGDVDEVVQQQVGLLPTDALWAPRTAGSRAASRARPRRVALLDHRSRGPGSPRSSPARRPRLPGSGCRARSTGPRGSAG